MTQDRLKVGWKEWVLFPELNGLVVEAKVDTGAKTSALHAFELETFEGEQGLMARFSIPSIFLRIKRSSHKAPIRYIVLHNCITSGFE